MHESPTLSVYCVDLWLGFGHAVTYLQHNNGGITVFGFVLDRGLLHTLFAFEFSLVLWILSKVIVLSWDGEQLRTHGSLEFLLCFCGLN